MALASRRASAEPILPVPSTAIRMAISDTSLGVAGPGPEVDPAIDREPVDLCQLIRCEPELVERCQVVIELFDRARPNQRRVSVLPRTPRPG